MASRDALRFCIVIPHYRHAVPLARLVPRLAGYGLPIYVVDDSSGAPTIERLRALAAEHPSVRLLERDANGGKGAAMITGLQVAHAAGFTHAVSLDADGQHDPATIGEMLERARSAPEHLLTGRPVFGPDVPKSRLYGRELTNGLVRFVTGSQAVRDAMCGLRVYPLTRVLPLCEQIGYRTRMEFDVEILVRACWAGIEIENVATRVTYPEDGTSHFHMFADNVRLTLMHALLICGGLRRRLARFGDGIRG